MFKGQFHPACFWNKTLKEFAFQQNITFHCLFLNLRPVGAPISRFLAWMHNHFCVKLSSLSCNKRRKMPVEKSFYFFNRTSLNFAESWCSCFLWGFPWVCGVGLFFLCVIFLIKHKITGMNRRSSALRELKCRSHRAAQGIIIKLNHMFHTIENGFSTLLIWKGKLEHRIPCATPPPPLSLVVMTALQKELISRFPPVSAATSWA